MENYQEKLEQLKKRIATGMTNESDVVLLEQIINKQEKEQCSKK